MAYSNFTLQTVQKAFQLEMVHAIGLFADRKPIAPSAALTEELAKKVPLASAIRTEKARSELIVAGVLVELLEHFDRRISFFSGIEFNVDADEGLTGACDFLVSLSPNQLYLETPIISLVEVKKDEPLLGLGQCVAEMIAAQRFNAESGNDIRCVYGAATTGTEWHFLKLEGTRLSIDMAVYPIAQCDKILGILASMVEQKV